MAVCVAKGGAGGGAGGAAAGGAPAEVTLITPKRAHAIGIYLRRMAFNASIDKVCAVSIVCMFVCLCVCVLSVFALFVLSVLQCL
jgi:hypothetical protein